MRIYLYISSVGVSGTASTSSLKPSPSLLGVSVSSQSLLNAYAGVSWQDTVREELLKYREAKEKAATEAKAALEKARPRVRVRGTIFS